MISLHPNPPGQLILIHDAKAAGKALLTLAAHLALQGPVYVLDGGNSFDVYRVARLLRRHTVHIAHCLDRIWLRRAFTPFQLVSQLEQTAVSPHPLLILDLLATLETAVSEAAIRPSVAQHLATAFYREIARLQSHRPVVVGLRTAVHPAWQRLVQQLQHLANQRLHLAPPTAVSAPAMQLALPGVS